MIDSPRQSWVEALLLGEGALQAPDVCPLPARVWLPDTTAVKVHQVGLAVCVQQNIADIKVRVVDPLAVKVSQHSGDGHDFGVCQFPLAQNFE